MDYAKRYQSTEDDEVQEKSGIVLANITAKIS
jgi:hypothetical protein